MKSVLHLLCTLCPPLTDSLTGWLAVGCKVWVRDTQYIHNQKPRERERERERGKKVASSSSLFFSSLPSFHCLDHFIRSILFLLLGFFSIHSLPLSLTVSPSLLCWDYAYVCKRNELLWEKITAITVTVLKKKTVKDTKSQRERGRGRERTSAQRCIASASSVFSLSQCLYSLHPHLLVFPSSVLFNLHFLSLLKTSFHLIIKWIKGQTKATVQDSLN